MAEEIVAKVEELLSPYVGRSTELIQALHRVQEGLGYVPKESLWRIAELMRVPPSRVNEAVSYTHLTLPTN